VNDFLGWILLALGILNAVVSAFVFMRISRDDTSAAEPLMQQVKESTERLERELRRDILEASRDSRQELALTLATFQQTLVQQGAEATRTQNTQIDAFGQQLALLQKTLHDTLTSQLSGLSESNARRMNEIRETLEKQLSFAIKTAPKLTIQGGTTEVLRGIIARGLGLR